MDVGVNEVVVGMFVVRAFGCEVVSVKGFVEVVLVDGVDNVLEEDEPGGRAKDGTLVDGIGKRLRVRTFGLDKCSGSARSEEGLKESDELWVKAGVLVFANEDGSVDPLKRGLDVGGVEGGLEVDVGVVDPC